VQSISLPFPKDADYPTSKNWIVCFLFPAFTAALNILMWVFLIKKDAIEVMIKKDATPSELTE
jgi:hypothetical protein